MCEIEILKLKNCEFISGKVLIDEHFIFLMDMINAQSKYSSFNIISTEALIIAPIFVKS